MLTNTLDSIKVSEILKTDQQKLANLRNKRMKKMKIKCQELVKQCQTCYHIGYLKRKGGENIGANKFLNNYKILR